MSETTAFRNARRNSFTQVSNSLLNDADITLQAKGLLMIFLSNTDDWKIQMPEIIKRSKNGREATYNALQDLIKHGYVARIEYKDTKTKRYVKQEYVFSDHKEDVQKALKDAKALEKNESLYIIIHYMNKELEEKAPSSEVPDTGFPNTGFSNPENPYINNTNNKNTNNKNTNNNLNNMHYLKEDNEQETTSNTSNSSQSSKHVEEKIKDKDLKDFTFNKYPERIRLEIGKLNFEDAKTMMDITNKAKRAVAKEYDDMKKEPLDFSYETHEYEISSILCRMVLKSKMDNLSIESLSRYISRSIQNYYSNYANNEIEEMVERDMSSTDFDKFFINLLEK